jgi:hypothetical protein
MIRARIPRSALSAPLLAGALAAACAGSSGADAAGTETTLATCADGVDNDADGATDCADLYCQAIGACGDTDTDSDSDADADADTDTDPGAPAKDVRITRVELCQTVCTDVMDGFEPQSPLVPIVPGREALVRVHVALLVSWDWRSLWAEMRFASPAAGEETLLQQISPEAASSENDLDSTINFTLPAAVVADGLQVAFALREIGAHVAPGPDSTETVWPAEGLAAIPVAAAADPVRIVVVPVRYWGDGSGRLPDVSDGVLESIARTFAAMYPIDRIELAVAGPFDWETPVLADGAGWGELLSAITELRSDGADYEEYYYGLFDPAESFGGYCGGGCILGLSWLAESASDSWARTSIGIDFSMPESTMAHEVGHAHGLWHAPCGVFDDADPEFPYGDGTIGVTGWSSLTGTLMGPMLYDFMSYCDPDWVSDYHYLALRERIEELSGAKGPTGDAGSWSGILVRPDGTLAPGPTLRLAAPPTGPTREVVWRDAAKRPIGMAAGRFQPFADLPGGMVLVPAPPDDAAFAELDGHPPLAIRPR